MNKVKTLISIFISAIFLSATLSRVSNASDYGTTGGQILNIYTSARMLGMGNAGVGLADDLNAVMHNPAGLVNIESTQAQFSHIVYFVETSLNSVIIAGERDELGIGIKYKQLRSEDVVRDATGREGNEFDIRFHHVRMAGGYSLNDRHSLGGALNLIMENYHDVENVAFCVDVGWYFKVEDETVYSSIFGSDVEREIKSSYGIVLRNIGPDINVEDTVDVAMPLELAAGGAHNVNLFNEDFRLLWEFFAGLEDYFSFRGGVEYEVDGMDWDLTARGGFEYVTEPRITLGMGFPQDSWYLDYALLFHRNLGTNHRFSVGIDF